MSFEYFSFSPTVTNWVIIPSLIFIARVIDVSLSTVRIILVVQGKRIEAALLGFVEILIWLVAISQILQNLNNFMCYLSFGAGFSVGTYFGMILERKLAIGIILVRIITTQKDGSELTNCLRNFNYRVTSIDAEGNLGKVNVLFTVISKKNINELINIIQKFNPQAFYTIENINSVNQNSPPLISPDQNKITAFLKRIKIK